MEPATSRDVENAATAARQSRVERWAPWIGAAAGGTVFAILVRGEGDLVRTGKLMWVGIGAGIGAGAGWIVGKIVAANQP